MDPIGAGSNAITVAGYIYDRCSEVLKNAEHGESIKKRIKDLQKLGEELKKSDLQEFPLQCRESIHSFNDSINECERLCHELLNERFIKHVAFLSSQKTKLKNLERELENAHNSLTLGYNRAVLMKVSSFGRQVKETSDRLEATVIHPMVGIYPGRSNKHSTLQRISQLAVNEDQNDLLLVVKWHDHQNSAESVERYEVRYDDGNNMIVTETPDNLQSDESTSFQMKLGTPKLTRGRKYTFQVRAVNSQGPGEWSEAVIRQYKKGVPNKPQKPKLTVNSPTKITVTVPLDTETNGSPITKCVVEYMMYADNISNNWQCLSYDICDHRDKIVNVPVESLTPSTVYTFRVKMVNEDGESKPSESVQEFTQHCIPGPPQGLRVSSKRSDKSIKIRWNIPAVNPQAVAGYEAQILLAKKNCWSTFKTMKHSKLSATNNDLKSNTKYKFRVIAFSDKDLRSESSEELEAETRCGKGARIAAATGAFIGGTFGGPLLGAAGFGMMAGESASDRSDSKAGKAAAGTAAGISGGVAGALIGTVGAPLFGGVSSYLAYKDLQGKLDDVSPQSSEDEEEESEILKAFKEQN